MRGQDSNVKHMFIYVVFGWEDIDGKEVEGSGKMKFPSFGYQKRREKGGKNVGGETPLLLYQINSLNIRKTWRKNTSTFLPFFL